MNYVFDEVGLQLPDILLPSKDVNLNTWSVVACDQYTSQPEYWTKVAELVGNEPSTLSIIFPEVLLEEEGKEARIKNINETMNRYLENKILIPNKPGFIYIDRKTSHVSSRKGLITAIDLEKYDYSDGSKSLIRATEGTVLDRLPPRIKIREKAPLELPHIMVLIDDPNMTVIEPLSSSTSTMEKLYDFELMMNGGHIKGYKVEAPHQIENIVNALQRLADPDYFMSKYNTGDKDNVLLFAVGDGNHSLATAKAHWENIKKNLPKEALSTHPSRYALVEIVNVHDDGLQFEPIHRIVFNVDVKLMLEAMVKYFNKSGSDASYIKFQDERFMNSEIEALRSKRDKHIIPYITAEGKGIILIENPKYNLEVGSLQCFLDEYMKTNSQIKIDYIHGDDVVDALGSKDGNIGFLLPQMNKHDLFKTVIIDGVLPRKTFSMGEAEEKRFYLECRKIVY
jgi:hypothetical protein